MKKRLLYLRKALVIIFLLPFLSVSAQVTVEVDHSDWVYHPLMKVFGVNVPHTIEYNSFINNAELIKDLDIRYVRIMNSWGKEASGNLFETPQVTVEGETVQYDFTRIDEIVDLIYENGAQVLFMNGYNPESFGGQWNAAPDTSAGGLWYELNKTFAAHWAGKNLPFVAYEIWNGVDDTDYLDDDGVFERMVYRARQAIAEVQSMPKIGGGGFFTTLGAEAYKSQMFGNPEGGHFVNTRVNIWTAQAVGFDALDRMFQREIGADPGPAEGWRGRVNWFDYFRWELWLTSYSSHDTHGPDAVNHVAANAFFDDASYILRYSDVNRIYLNQFIDGNDGAKGLVTADGVKSPLYNALKLYNEMPTQRKGLTSSNDNIKGFASSDGHNAYMAIWNVSDADSDVNVSIDNLPFSTGSVELFRIDATNDGSMGEALEDLSDNEFEWNGTLPGRGVVIIRIKDNTDTPSFPVVDIGDVVNDFHYWWFRKSEGWKWHTFDPKTMSVYLGDTISMPRHRDDGYPSVNWGVSSCGIYIENLAEQFHVLVEAQGKMKKMDQNTHIMFRIDFEDDFEGDIFYGTTVAFVDEENFVYYDPGHDSNPYYGSGQTADRIVQVDYTSPEGFLVDVSQYASPFWTGNAVLTFSIQNAGTGEYYYDNPEEAGQSLIVLFKLREFTDPVFVIDSPSPESFGMKIYPVPARDNLTIAFDREVGNASVTISDIAGRIVSQKELRNFGSEVNMPVGELPVGIYFMTVRTPFGTRTGKIMISR